LRIRFNCELEHADPLAQLVHEKTAGNPFFAISVRFCVGREELLNLSIVARRGGAWDLHRIDAKGLPTMWSN